MACAVPMATIYSNELAHDRRTFHLISAHARGFIHSRVHVFILPATRQISVQRMRIRPAFTVSWHDRFVVTRSMRWRPSLNASSFRLELRPHAPRIGSRETSENKRFEHVERQP